MNSFDRRNEILEVLSQRRSSTLRYFSEKFDVSEKTISTDIEILSLEYPIFTIQGKNGGVFVDDDWKYKPKCLTNEQLGFLKKLKSRRFSRKDYEIIESLINDFSAP